MSVYKAKPVREVNRTIKKILIGKLIQFYYQGYASVILDVKYDEQQLNPNQLMILVGRYYDYSKYGSTCQAQVSNWTRYSFDHEPYYYTFINRSSKEMIRECLKMHPDKVKYHIGKCADMNKLVIYDHYDRVYFDPERLCYDKI